MYVLSSESSYDLTALKNVQRKILISSHLKLRKIFFQLKELEGCFLGNAPEEGILEN